MAFFHEGGGGAQQRISRVPGPWSQSWSRFPVQVPVQVLVPESYSLLWWWGREGFFATIFVLYFEW